SSPTMTKVKRVKPKTGSLGSDSSRTEALSVDALDPGDHGLGAQLGDDGAEMLEVIDFQVDGELGEVGRAPADMDVVDISVMLGDTGADLGQAAGLVDGADHDPRWKALWRRIVHVPADVEPALRFFLELPQRR